MTKTFGEYLFSQVIPAKYMPVGPLNKKTLGAAALQYAKDDPVAYAKSITEIKELGDEVSTLEGLSVGLDDIAPVYKERDAIMKPALAAMKATNDRDEKLKIIGDTQTKLLAYTSTHPGTMGIMARSGGRGNMVQLMKTVGSPTGASDEHDDIQPWLITKSYAEGLRPSEFWAAQREARMAAVKSNIEVAEPGDLSKILVNNVNSQVVTMGDCGTHNGLSFSSDDTDILDRYLARAVGSYARDTLITPRVQAELKKLTDKVIVRSPMTCEADDGMCQKCAGLDATGKVNSVGTNVGIRAAHSLGEPLTQLSLNAKHGVRLAGGATTNAEVGGLAGFRSIIESPQTFKNKAALALLDGKITKITPAPQGGTYIYVDDVKHYASPGMAVFVKVFDKVNRGDVLSDGVPKPDEVVALKGLGAGRAYMVNQLSNIYRGAGIKLDRRHLETLAKSALNYVKVDSISKEDTDKYGIVRGDVINYNKYKNMIQSGVESVKLPDAIGKRLGQNTLQHFGGTSVTPEMLRDFNASGIKEVKVMNAGPVVTPIMSPATRNPLLNPDWLARLGHRYLKQTILDAATQGQETNVHSVHPIPSLVFGTEFGQGTAGKY